MIKWIAVIVGIGLLIKAFLKWKGQFLQEQMTKAFLKEMAKQARQSAGPPFEEYENLYLALTSRTNGPADEEFEALPEEMKDLFITSVLDMEIQNGGLCQFLVNYGSECARRAADSLRAIGFHEMADAYERFVGEQGIKLTSLQGFHSETAEQFSALYRMYPFEQFDEVYMKLRRKLKFEKTVLDYANTHPEAFR